MANDLDPDKVRAVLDQIVENGEAIGGFTHKAEARRTGFSLHVRYENEVDIETSLMALQIMVEAPGRYANALRRLLGEDPVID